MLAPVDLIYVCGNKFLATNATPQAQQVEYRVVGTKESGSITLSEAPAQDPGHSETELETTNRGVVELYQSDQRVARRGNEGALCGARPSFSVVASSSSPESGSWGAPFSWPIVALHVSLLPDGKVLAWGLTGSPQVWDPATGTFTEVASPVELFCSGHSFLPDGRLLVTGGHIANHQGLPDITIFTPGSQSWSRSTPMSRGRWYPTNTTMANGDVVILAGRDEVATLVGVPEVWSSGAVRALSTANMELPYYPRTFLAPNGKLFYAGELQTARYLDPTGTGSWAAAAKRLYGLRDYGAAAMYEPGKILYVGGGRTTNTAEIIDLNTAGWAAWHWTGSMAYPRRHLNATVLPNGQVLVTGGSSGTGFNDVALAVHAAEVWDPTTGVWTTLASNTVNRTYHATSILLPDGRVLHAGSGDNGSPSERNAELFSPPYLFKGPRPTISAAPEAVGYATSFVVATPEASDIAKVSFIRLGSVTHAFDMNQRFQWLPFTSEAGVLTITAPTSPNRTPPGHYMLFILDSKGVPSTARIVRVSSDAPPNPPPNAAPVPDFSFLCNGLTCDFTDGSTDSDGTVTAWSWAFGDGTTSTDRNPSRTFASEGSYTITLTITDDDGATSQHSASMTVTPPAPPNVPPAASFTAGCVELFCTFADSSADSDGSLAGWLWNFGDGASSTVQSPSHGYAAGGTYTVTLTVTDNIGATGTASREVVPTPNAPPAAQFSSSCIGLTCTFTDGSTDGDGTVTAWNWTFGDGTSSSDPNPSRTYASAGDYTVTVRVTDDRGATDQRSAAVTVTAPAAPVTNMHWHSEDITKLALVGAATTANVTVAPDGQTTADLLEETLPTGAHKLLLQGRPDLPNNAKASVSVYVKPNGRKNWALEFRLKSGLFAYARFDLQAGVTLSADPAVTPYAPTDVGNGWWRIGAGIPDVGAGTTNYQPRLVMVADNGTTTSYPGTLGIGGHVWGIQEENQTVTVGRYVPTGAGPATSP